MEFNTKKRGIDVKVMKRDVHKAKPRNMRKAEFKNDSLDVSKNGDRVHGRLSIYKKTGKAILARTINFSYEGKLTDAKKIGVSLRKNINNKQKKGTSKNEKN